MTDQSVDTPSTGDFESTYREARARKQERQRFLLDRQLRRERQFRLYSSVAVICIFLGGGIILARDWIFITFSGYDLDAIEISAFARSIRGQITLTGAAVVAAGVFAVLYLYLQTGFRNWTSVAEMEALASDEMAIRKAAAAPSQEQIEAIVETALKPMHDKLMNLQPSTGILDHSARAELVKSIKQSLIEDTATSVIAEVEAKIAVASQRDLSERDFSERIRETRGRLLEEVKALQRRGNLNLLFGGTITAAALYVLWTTVSWTMVTPEPKWADNPWALASHFGPRLALALFLQVFAYFFLKLYKSSLSEIKYFQNELTNIEAKQLAVNAALRGTGAESLKDVVSSFLATERNHILGKDQTTVELEKARLDKDQKSEIIKYVTELFQKRN